MRKTIFTAIALCVSVIVAAQGNSSRENLEKHVYTLADDSMNGRAAGSPDAARAREYIIGEYSALGLRPFFKDWEMRFESQGGSFCNVVGVIDGSDPVLKNEYIVLGAHYDHLGVKSGKVYNGADDNASGTAAVIEVARALCSCREKLDRSVVIAAFDAEELGLFGSSALSKALSDSLDIRNVRLMMSIDMVGWYRQSGYLELEGIGTIRNGETLARAEAEKLGINLRLKKFETSVFTATDTEGFAKKGVPTLAVTTGLKSPYHKPEDDPELIDYDGLDKVSGYITDLTLAAAGDPAFMGSGKVAEKHMMDNKPFEIGIWGGFAPTSVSFPSAKFRTDSRLGFTGGLAAQVNSGEFGIRLGAEYGWLPCRFPDETDLYGGSVRFDQQALTVPLAVLLQTNGQAPIRGYVGLGGYYRRLVDSGFDAAVPSYTAKPDQWGWQWTIGYKLGHFSMELESRWQIGTLFSGPSAPSARLNTTSVKLGFVL